MNGYAGKILKVDLSSRKITTIPTEKYEQWGGGHGVFTFCMLEGLKGAADDPAENSSANGDSIVTLGELMDYVDERVRRETKAAQHPDTSGRFNRAWPMAKVKKKEPSL